ncbi:hypothetical protein [Anaeromicrobium sediminis]|uniref:Uncharacterized protein n=1 Tax=Anaeromicrobium sediminis TaxID=1478221 RepID=A0A267MJ42_9FIRM|nr:hypothetical protein [Anaeromicrobium sediminis]PAB59611.1 hypothetical protein CCE28_08560 [Anaeromicrobium sediminis]
MRMGFKDEKNMDQYKKLRVDGIDVYLSSKIESEKEGIVIFLEKIFFIRRLDVKGIKIQLQ